MTRGSRHLSAAIAVLAMVALLMAGLPSGGRAQGSGAVTVAVAPSVDMALLIVAVKKGFLEKQGLRTQLKVFDSSPKAVEALVAGQADITENTEPPHLAARARGAKVVQVMTGYVSGQTNGSVVNGAAIKKPEDFVGKIVGVQRGSGANFHLVWFLEKNKIPADKVTVTFMAAPDQIPALARNDIQAFFSWEPFLTRAQDSVPNARIWARATDDGLEFRGNVLMREEMAKNDRDTAIKVVKGLIEAADWMSANPKDAAKVANEVLRAPSEEEVVKQLQNFKWTADFKKSAKEQELKIAEWGVGIGLFPTKDAKTLVDQLVYPDLMKAAAPARTDM
ncbi:MAG TPA: ABC transporter substrate-binding protein [Candidatus Methylomirabilis sp.]|nr:ABC transporter substrate-binding protein [Candidatus Methylomirabilis sp.]